MTSDEYYDLDQPYDLMVDNLLDMAHVDFYSRLGLGQFHLSYFLIVPCGDHRIRLLSQFYRDFAR